MIERFRQKGTTFYCINGHPQSYTETENAALKKQLEQQKAETERERLAANSARAIAETARKAERIARGKLKAQTERVKNGVCPCCTRSFTNLRRHMETKHPEFNNGMETP